MDSKLTLIMLRTATARLCRSRPGAPEAGVAGVSAIGPGPLMIMRKWRSWQPPALIMNKARPDTMPVLSVLLERVGIPSLARLQPVIMSLVLLGWHLCHDHDRPASGLAAGAAGELAGSWG